MKKAREIHPLEALLWQDEIDQYCRAMAKREPGSILPFEQRLWRALQDRERAQEFFADLAAACPLGTNQWYRRGPAGEPEIRWLAIQARIWLDSLHQSVNRDAVRVIVRILWAAHRMGLTLGLRDWSELDYLQALHRSIETDVKLQTKLHKYADDHFPSRNVWKRVWRDPLLKDIRPLRQGRPSLV